MKGKLLVAATIGLSPFVATYAIWQYNHQTSNPDLNWIAPSSGDAQLQGKHLYETYCASCHGVSLEGQLRWRHRMANGRLPAPPHNDSGHTWHHPDHQLIDITKRGIVGGVNAPDGYQSDMPSFGQQLSDEQIRQILAYIKSMWNKDSLSRQRQVTEESLR